MCRCHVVVGHRAHLQYEVSVLTARTQPKHNYILAKPVDDISAKPNRESHAEPELNVG
jgi:hypothetical protein